MNKLSTPKILFYLRIFLFVICVTGMTRDKVYFNTYLSIASGLQENKMSIFQTYLEISVHNCVEECKLIRACSFINFRVQTRTCELVKSSTDSVLIAKVPGYVFGKKYDWDMTSLDICSSCSDNERCRPETPTPVCEVTACGTPEVANGTSLIGNVYRLDARLKYACATGYIRTGSSVIMCQVNGSWDAINTCTEEIDNCPLTTDYRGTTLSDGSQFNYWLVQNSYTQLEAMNLCMSCQGTLVVVLGHPKMNFLRDLLISRGDGFDYWVDGSNANATDYFSDDAWTTSSGETIPISSVLWAPGRPNYQQKEHCVRLKGGENYYLDNIFCTSKYRAICEQ